MHCFFWNNFAFYCSDAMIMMKRSAILRMDIVSDRQICRMLICIAYREKHIAAAKCLVHRGETIAEQPPSFSRLDRNAHSFYLPNVIGQARRGQARSNQTASSASPAPTCSASSISLFTLKLKYSGENKNVHKPWNQFFVFFSEDKIVFILFRALNPQTM